MSHCLVHSPFQLLDTLVKQENSSNDPPETVGFEYHLGGDLPIDVAYYYSRSEIRRYLEEKKTNQKASKRSLVRLQEILEANPNLFEYILNGTYNGLWIELDTARPRLQIYLDVSVASNNDWHCLLLNRARSSSSAYIAAGITYIGYVYYNVEELGYKILCKQPAVGSEALLCRLETFKQLALRHLHVRRFQVGYSFLGGQLHEISIEVDTDKDRRYSSRENWNQLLNTEVFKNQGWTDGKTNINHFYAYRINNRRIQISGINHIKFSSCLEHNTTPVAKMYAGVMSRMSLQ